MKKKYTKKKSKSKSKKETKIIYKEYSPGLKYMIFDGNKNVFKYIYEN
jgi:hypothetical protein